VIWVDFSALTLLIGQQEGHPAVNKSSAVAEMGDRLATVDMGRKVGGGILCPFPLGGAGSPSNSVAWAEAYLHTKWHLDPSSRLATIHNVTDRQDRQTGQQSHSIGRPLLVTVAQKPAPFLVDPAGLEWLHRGKPVKRKFECALQKRLDCGLTPLRACCC